MKIARLARIASISSVLATACAFPFEPGAKLDGGPDPSSDGGLPCPGPCAGTCANGACVPARVGEACDVSAAGAACVAGSSCVFSICTDDACTSGPCRCEGRHCAGRCVEGACLPAGNGERCDAAGTGVACVSGACTDGTCHPPPSFDPVAIDDYLAVAAVEYCAYLLRCDGWPAALADDCAAAVFDATPVFDSDAEELRSVGQGLTEYSAQAAGDCLHGFPLLACHEPFPDACTRVFTGAAPEGASCTSQAHCVAGTACVLDDLSGLRCQGRCTARAGLGDDCSQAACLEALTCASDGDPAAPTHHCRAPTAPGGLHGACGVGPTRCAGSLYCSPSTGTCEPPHGVNALCDDELDCEPGTTCSLVDDFQRARCLPKRRRGEACESNQQCSPITLAVATDFCDGGHCGPLPSQGACVVDAFLRNTCDPVLASCRGGRCTPYSPQHGACDTSDDCGALLGGMICTFSTCEAPQACGGGP